MREIDAGAFARWAFNALIAIFVIIAGFYVSPWLGASSFELAVVLWAIVLAGLLYAAGAIPWISRLGPAERFLHAYAPPLTEEEKNQLRERHREREQRAAERALQDEEEIRRQQLGRTFFDDPANSDAPKEPVHPEPGGTEKNSH